MNETQPPPEDQQDAAPVTVANPAATSADTRDFEPSFENAGHQIGPYKLIEKLGEGGFGSVWMAEQREPVKRRVALKIVKLGMDTREVIARFEAERQALALMHHPHIAQVFDAGVTLSGRPYFAMELVLGVTMVHYCDQAKLDIRGRLALFVQVCQAIQHAHQKGVIHRDIKPSNVLVTLPNETPIVKVIDFGIAKATGMGLTETTLNTLQGEAIGTPVYMSPEQAAGQIDIDTRSDIYSLGVLLYELLTGTTPFSHLELIAHGFAEMVRIVRETEPPRPSTRVSERVDVSSVVQTRAVASQLRGDLDWIALKCLEKDRSRRYDTANALAMDVQRHLDGEAVLAAPPSRAYRAAKFFRRHKVGVSAAIVVMLALIVGMAGTLWQADRALMAEAQARHRADEFEKIARFQEQQLSGIESAKLGSALRQQLLESVSEPQRSGLESMLVGTNFTDLALGLLDQSVLERVAGSVEAEFPEQPLIQARLLQSVASTRRDLGLFDAAIAPQEKALALRRNLLGNEHTDTLESISQAGMLAYFRNQLEQANALFSDALATRKRLLGPDHPDTLSSMDDVATAYYRQGRLDEAEPLFRAALAGRRRVLGDNDPKTLTSINNLSILLQSRGQLAAAEPLLREALAGLRRRNGDEHSDTMIAAANLGVVLRQQKKFEEAEPLLREALETRRRVLGDRHIFTIYSTALYSAQQRDMGNLEDALALGEESVRNAQLGLPENHPVLAVALLSKAGALNALNRHDEAEPLALDAWERNMQHFGANHQRTQDCAALLAKIYADRAVLEPGKGFDAKAAEWRSKLTKDRRAQ